MSRPYSRLEHVCRAIWLSRFRWRNTVAMFSAHFDESGTPDDTHVVLTVAGFVSSVDKWVRFGPAWKKLLAEAGLPDGTIFHMNWFARNLPPFEQFAGQSKRKATFMEGLPEFAFVSVSPGDGPVLLPPDLI